MNLAAKAPSKGVTDGVVEGLKNLRQLCRRVIDLLEERERDIGRALKELQGRAR